MSELIQKFVDIMISLYFHFNLPGSTQRPFYINYAQLLVLSNAKKPVVFSILRVPRSQFMHIDPCKNRNYVSSFHKVKTFGLENTKKVKNVTFFIINVDFRGIIKHELG